MADKLFYLGESYERQERENFHNVKRKKTQVGLGDKQVEDQSDIESTMSIINDEEIKEQMNYFDQFKAPNKKLHGSKQKKNHQNFAVRLHYASQIQIHDFLLRQDLEILNDSSYMVSARPSGVRYLVTSSNGKTTSRNSSGYLTHQFESNLPNGSKGNTDEKVQFQMKSNKRNCSALDCIYVEKEETFYIIDLICWDEMIYTDFPFCSRILFLQQKFHDIPKPISQKYKFKLLEYQPCNTNSFLQAYFGQALTPYVNNEESMKLPALFEISLDEDKILLDLKDQASYINSHYMKLLKVIEEQNLERIEHNKALIDVSYAINLMQRYAFEPKTSDIFLKDGIMFSHLENPYEKGLNTLVLHWRDEKISQFCKNDDEDDLQGYIGAVLKLNDNFEFVTLDEEILKVQLDPYSQEQVAGMNPGNLYNLKIKINILQIIDVHSNQKSQELIITELIIQKRTSKLFPDHLSKIISKWLQLNNQYITASEIVQSIENNQEPLFSISTKSISSNDKVKSGQVSQTNSNDTNCMEMELDL
ncbi:UNKNOWN [Stylonychia lemnae]|uniref:Snurportin-1 n=1 Tax=Stylonychia lemnae TaxID=5949 RepID=A0A078ADC7_STYLE|nr:UNKNOWN [Stylonychia lemnae]|eukprot:CDW79532.1 UNKNOWN [Stylonychia lemnae]